jgi:hypothetical protein
MYWIEFRKNEPIRDVSLEQRSCIPEELKYPSWETNKDTCNTTPVMLLIRWRLDVERMN